jgi:hypothetical protein
MNRLKPPETTSATAKTPAEEASRSFVLFSITFHRAWMMAEPKARAMAAMGIRRGRS